MKHLLYVYLYFIYRIDAYNKLISCLKLKIISLIIICLLLKISFNLINKKYKIKVCVCTCGRNENKYAREFVQHYIKYGTDTIFIYDNNDIDGEKFETVLDDYIKQGYVKILDWRGKTKIQKPAFNHCYQENKNNYDWIIFFDFDEFIYLKDFNNIKDYLNQNHFKKCNIIYLNHALHTDNNQIFYVNNSLSERFPQIETISKLNYTSKYISVLSNIIKSIVKGNLENIDITNPHTLDKNISNGCNGFGRPIYQGLNIHLMTPDYKYYYFDHYYFKSSEEFVDKLIRGSVYYGMRNMFELYRFLLYFAFNEITEKKLKFFEEKTNLDLSFFKNNSWNQIYKKDFT